MRSVQRRKDEPGSVCREHCFAELFNRRLNSPNRSFGYTVDVRAPNRSGLRIKAFSLGLLVLAGAGIGCHKKSDQGGQGGLNADSVKQSLAALKPQFAELKKRYMDLRERVAALPHDLPGFDEARARFYSADEARGVTEAKLVWLSSQLDAAVASKNREELQQVSQEIARTPDDIRKIDELHTKMLHEMMSFERMARQAQAAADAPPSPTPAAPKPKRSKSKP